jgi:mono/diheme cytochrome c family protein
MRRSWVVVSAAVLGLAAATSSQLAAGLGQGSSSAVPPAARPAARAQAPATTAGVAAVSTQAPDRAFVEKYCATCHNDRAKTGGVSFQGLDPAAPGAHAELWERALLKMRGGMMPPQGMPRPDAPVFDGFIASLESALDRQFFTHPDPGIKPVHRLNRTEYGNAVRDLLDLEVDVTDLLPADDESHGFDNIAGVLRVSPSLLEQYLDAARRVSSLAVGTDRDLVRQIYRIPPDDSQEEHVDGLPLGTRGGFRFEHNFQQDAEYEFSVKLVRNIVGYMTGLEFAHTLEISLDGERVFSAQVGGPEDNLASDRNMSEAGNMIDERLKTRVKVSAGPHAVGITFVRRNAAESDEPLQPQERNHDLQDMNGLPLIEYATLTGPFDPTGPGDTPSRRKIFACRPATADVPPSAASRRSAPESSASDSGCAHKILSTLARRAYRRPVTDADMKPIMALFDSKQSAGFDAGIEQGLRLILANPKFLFRTEAAPARGTAKVTDLELASRLSFFLWSSIPDDTLVTLAAQNRLSQPAVLEQQVKRMLLDPKSRAMVDNFAGQWLLLRNLKGHTPVNADFPSFDNELRQAFRTETQMFFESIMREDRSVLDLLRADYTFVNERLARHYGIPNVYGSHFRRVTHRQDERRGLLGQGSILTVTSYPNRTSPVLRGKYILENILGTPPSPPPPNIDTTLENKQGEPPKSVRALLEEHRRNPTCAACHRVMDPLGFALENFDGIGEYRVKEVTGKVDPSGQLGDGTVIDGPVALRNAILKRPEMFVRTFTEKLMTYGLGRGVEFHDRPMVRAIARDTQPQGYKFSSVVIGIVKSLPFQQKKAQDAAGALAVMASH